MPPELAPDSQPQDDTADLEAYLDADDDAFAAMGPQGSTDDGQLAHDAEDDGQEVVTSADEADPPAQESTAPDAAETASEPPSWASTLFETMAAQNKRMEELLSTISAGFTANAQPAQPPEPEAPDVPEAEQLMSEAMALPAGHPSRAQMLRAASMAMLESEWSGNPDALAEVAKAKEAARRQAHGFKDMKGLQELVAEARGEMTALKRERALEANWSRIARGLPTLEDKHAQAFPHARRLFNDPAALSEYVLAEAGKSADTPEHEAIGRALSELEQALADLETMNPAELRAAARAMGRSDPMLRRVVMAYAKVLETEQAEAEPPPSPPAAKKPSTPRGPAGGRVVGANNYEQFLDIDDPNEWYQKAARQARAKA